MKPIAKWTVLLMVILAPALAAAQDTDAKALWKKGNAMYDQGNYEAALTNYTQAEKLTRDGTQSFWIAQMLAQNLDRLADSLPFYARAIERGNTNSWVYRQQAWALYKTGGGDDAIAAGRKALELCLQQIVKSKTNELSPDLRTETLKCLSTLARVYNGLEKWGDTVDIMKGAFKLMSGIKDKDIILSACEAAVVAGHRFFAAGDYAKAVEFYKLADLWYARNSEAEKKYKEMGLPVVLDLAKKREALGKIKPLYVHRMHVIFIKETRMDTTNAKGGPVKGHNFLTDKQMIEAQLSLLWVKGMWEAMSGGRLSFEYSKEEATNVMTTFVPREFDVREPDYNTFEPDMGDIFYRNFRTSDSFVFFWNGENGLNTTANGSSREFPLVPWELYVKRGFTQVPANRNTPQNGPFLVLHELFHAVESMGGISPEHGYLPEKRKAFKNWTGEGEVDYFRWHFEKTLPKKGWTNMNFIARYPYAEITDAVYQSHRDNAAKLDLVSRKKAWELWSRARDLRNKGDREGSDKLKAEALAINPMLGK